MPKPRKKNSGGYQIRIRGVRRRQPDAAKIARAVIDLALAEAAREAHARAASNQTVRALGRTAITAHATDEQRAA